MTALEPFARWREQVESVFRAAYAAEAELLDVDDFPPLQRRLSDDEVNEFLGIVSDGQLVAVMELEAVAGLTRIASLAVLPSHARQGLASMLLQTLRDRCSDPIAVSTAADNEPALALYRRVGFLEIERVEVPEGLTLIELQLA